MAQRAPSPPRGTGRAGAALWRAVTAEYELEQHALLLREAIRTLDVLDDLAVRVTRDGAVVASSQGEGDRAHPALVEARQQRTPSPGCSPRCACRRVRSPSTAATAVRSAGARGVYGPRAVS